MAVVLVTGCSSGIGYQAIPPAKRFMQFDQLSGGEKTVASLKARLEAHPEMVERKPSVLRDLATPRVIGLLACLIVLIGMFMGFYIYTQSMSPATRRPSRRLYNETTRAQGFRTVLNLKLSLKKRWCSAMTSS